MVQKKNEATGDTNSTLEFIQLTQSNSKSDTSHNWPGTDSHPSKYELGPLQPDFSNEMDTHQTMPKLMKVR